MKPPSIMLIAGETSGDTLAAELVEALRSQLLVRDVSSSDDAQPLRTGLAPRFFGAGGSRMKAAGVELAFDLTQHSVIGISDVLKNYLKFRRLFHQLLDLALTRQPDVIIGVDYGGFNLRFGHAIRKHIRTNRGAFNNWNPKLVQFVSPQVWASRAGRAFQLEEDYDLVLSIFPFEKDWYAKRVPKLRVEFVGHPMAERFKEFQVSGSTFQVSQSSTVLLLPGSRRGELNRHLPVMLDALKRIQIEVPGARGRMVLPNESLAQLAKSLGAPGDLAIQIGDLPGALKAADIAIASTGTVTMECAFFGVPTVTLYKTSLLTYEIAKRIVKVKSLTMPNLMANAEVFPEFIQNAATPENISRAAIELLRNEARRAEIKRQLAEIIASLGGPGAIGRAAKAVASLLDGKSVGF
jgi:lipid-A-disaccharide synthase